MGIRATGYQCSAFLCSGVVLSVSIHINMHNMQNISNIEFCPYEKYCRQLQFSQYIMMGYEVRCMLENDFSAKSKCSNGTLCMSMSWTSWNRKLWFLHDSLLDSCISKFMYVLPANLSWQMNLSIMATGSRYGSKSSVAGPSPFLRGSLISVWMAETCLESDS